MLFSVASSPIEASFNIEAILESQEADICFYIIATVPLIIGSLELFQIEQTSYALIYLVLLVPATFTKVIAVAHSGKHSEKKESFGDMLIIDPSGSIWSFTIGTSDEENRLASSPPPPLLGSSKTYHWNGIGRGE
ncbi:unnamed protein product [Lactuca saligna]|uniref:Uncharacterized protein n=1 Tax=Lactuca saligna TaxID=75948 RepID=A0AA36ELU2_LACSI|nr:unnamed protein product [Lactuca saligna]